MKLGIGIATKTGDSTAVISHSVELPATSSSKNSSCILQHSVTGGTSSDITQISNSYFKIQLSSLSFSHEMFKPLRIDLSLTMNSVNSTKNSTREEISPTTFKGVALELYRSAYNLELDASYSYKKLVVGDIKYTSLKVNSSIYVVNLVLYSPDYLLTLNKGSQCYTGAKMSEIVTKSLLTFNGVTAVFNNLKNLMNADRSVEYRIPYVVQYQESTFDFLSRIARRYGEFMYYSGKDSQLQIGCEVTDATSRSLNIVKNTDYESVDYHGKIVDIMHEQSHAKYLTNNTDISSAVSSVKTAVGSNVDISTYGINRGRTSTATSDVISSSVAYDDYNTFNEFASVEGSEHYSGRKDYFFHQTFWPSLFMAGINSPTIFDGLANVSYKTVMTLLSQHYLSVYGNDLYSVCKDADNSNFADAENYCEVAKASTSKDPIDASKNHLTLSLTSKIELFSEYMRSNTITINYGASSSADMRLGHKISIDGDYYVIIAIDFNYDSTEIDGNVKLALNSKATAIPIFTNNNVDDYYPAKIDAPLYREAKPQVAFIVDSYDPSGYNRVRVKYPWQQDSSKYVAPSGESADDTKKNALNAKLKNVTPWIRISLPMASAGGSGLNFMPNEGDEVMVNYEDGNIERPYVDGMLFSTAHKPLYSKSSNMYKYIKSSNGHTLSFYDNPDPSEFITNFFPFADILSLICGKVNSVGDKKLAGYTMLSDTYGMYNLKLSSDERKISISSPYGTVDVSAFEGISISAPNGDISIKGKNISLEAGNNISIVSGNNIKNYAWKDYAKSFSNMLSAQVPKYLGSMFEFSSLRTLYEAIFRPLEGELSIKSNRDVKVEAGTGYAADNNNKGYNPKTLECLNKFGDFLNQYSRMKNENAITNLNADINLYNTNRVSLQGETTPLNTKFVDDPDLSITDANFDSYLPVLNNVNNEAEYYNFIPVFNQYDDKKTALKQEYKDAVCKQDVDLNNANIAQQWRARIGFLKMAKAVMTVYNDIINEYNQDKYLVTTFKQSNLLLNSIEAKYIYNFVQGLGADNPLQNYDGAKAANVSAVIRNTRSSNSAIAQEAFRISMLRFAQYIKDKDFGQQDYVSDVFGFGQGDTLTLSQNLIPSSANNFIPTNTINVPPMNSAVTASSEISLNWDKIMTTVNRAEVKQDGFGTNLLKALADEYSWIYKNVNGYIDESAKRNCSGNIFLTTNQMGYTSKFNGPTGSFLPNDDENNTVLSAMRIKV